MVQLPALLDEGVGVFESVLGLEGVLGLVLEGVLGLEGERGASTHVNLHSKHIRAAFC